MDGIARASPAFADDLDEDLLGYMAMKADDPVAAREAGSAFYERHKAFVFKILMKRGYARVLGGQEAICDLVQQTFCRAYERAETYKPTGHQERDRQRRACRQWLLGIARNLMREALTRRLSIVAEDSFDESIHLGNDLDLSEEGESQAAALVREELDRLTEREQDVLRITLEYFKPGEEHQRLPNAVAKSLATQLGTTPQNIRAIRCRAHKKLRARLAPLLAKSKEGAR